MIKVPGYIIKNEIGTGGMATVYLAVQTSLERKVALKVMAPALSADQAFSKRFLGEARTIARLNHPNIVPIYEVGVTDTYLHYFSMQHLPEGDLEQRVAGGIEEAELVEVLKGICGALGFAHEQGFIHRDVTPGNILFDKSGTPVLTDFGIARAVSQATRITGTGVSVGTSHYMSPEQARGGDVDPRSDLYSLGALIFEALAGRPPYEGADGFAIAYAHVFDPIPKLPEEYRHWQGLIETAMAKDPADRFENAQAFVTAMDEVLARAGSAAGDPADSSADATVTVPAGVGEDGAGFPGVLNRAGSRLASVWRATKGGLDRSMPFLPRKIRPYVAGGGVLLAGTVVAIASGIVGSEPEPAQTHLGAAEVSTSTSSAFAEPDLDSVVAPEPTVEEVAEGPVSVARQQQESLVLLDLKSGRKVAALDPNEAGSGYQATTAPDVRRIADLLSEAAQDVAVTRLMTPPGDNAFERYMTVLELDPGNPAAETGLGKIVESYQQLAERAIRDNNYRLASTFLQRAEQVAVSTPATTGMKAEIEGRSEVMVASMVATAEAYLASEDRLSAIDLFERVLAVRPGDAAVREALDAARLRPDETIVQDLLSNGDPGPEMKIIPGGIFTMGAGSDTAEVAITTPFAMGRHEVTLGEFRKFVDATSYESDVGKRPSCKEAESKWRGSRGRDWDAPGFAQGDGHPVVCITFDDAQAYAAWLSSETGQSYRLPSEAEWEYVARFNHSEEYVPEEQCRKGNVSDIWLKSQLPEAAIHECEDGWLYTAPVGEFSVSPAGLVDLEGNVREWVLDCDHKRHRDRPDDSRARLDGNCRRRIAKGNAWLTPPDESAPWERVALRADNTFATVGFRVLRVLD